VFEHDKKPKWWLFRSWGRIGTTIGNTKLEDFAERLDALRQFEALYEEKTGNRWKNRDKFQKVPKKMYPLEMDYGQDAENIKKLDVTKSKSKLDKKVQELITTIFDIDRMKKAMIEFEIDMTKMPMGKISKKQIEKAYGILTEVQNMIKNGDGTDSKFLDASNRFFTLIPHDFGLKTPPILNEPDYIKSKIEMLDSLLEIEVAYKLLKDGADDKEKDPIDVHYENLKTELNVLDKETDEFKTIEKYVKNTHAETHNLYTTPLKFKMYSKYIARASQKDSNHSNNCQTENCSGMVPELPTTLVFYHKVFVLHLQKLLLQVICLVKVFTSPIWFQNQQITVTLLGPTTLDYCYFVM
jgi:poly [ADP-ribose] polymerase